MIANYSPLLTLDEERAILSDLVASREEPEPRARYFELRERLALANLRLVRAVVNRYARNPADVDDLMQVGFLGLLRAIDGYDPARANGGKFATTAGWWIRSFLSRDAQAGARWRAIDPPAWFLDELPAGGEAREIAPRDDVGVVLSAVTARQRQVLAMAYGLEGRGPAPLKDVAIELGTSQANVSNIKRRAEARARKKLTPNEKAPAFDIAGGLPPHLRGVYS